MSGYTNNYGFGSDALSGGTRNMSGFGQLVFGKPTAPEFGQTPTTQSKFGGVYTGGTPLIGTPTATSASSKELFGQQNDLMGKNTSYGLFGSRNPNTSFEQSRPAGTGFPSITPIAQPYEYSDPSGFNKNMTVKANNHGVDDNFENLSWSIKENGWYSVLISSNVEDNDEVLKIIQAYITPVVFHPYNKRFYSYALGFLVDDYKVAKALHEANYKMIQRDDLKLTIEVSLYSPSHILLSKPVSKDINEKMREALAIRYNPINKSLDLSTFHACPFFTNYQLFVPLNQPRVLFAALSMVDEHKKNDLHALSLENNHINLGKNLKWICRMFPNLKVLNLAGNKLYDLKQLKRLSGYAIEELNLSRNPVSYTKDKERYRQDVRQFCPSVKNLFDSELPPQDSVFKCFSNGWNEE